MRCFEKFNILSVEIAFKTVAFFQGLGRYSVTKQEQYLRSIAEDPNNLKVDGLAAYKRPLDFLARAKAWVSSEDFINKFNDQVDEYNSKLKKNESYKKRTKIDLRGLFILFNTRQFPMSKTLCQECG